MRFFIMPSLKAIIIGIVLLFPLCSLAQVKAEERFNYKRGSYKGCYYDVVVSKNGKQHNITMFRPWEEIEKVLLSPDDHYMMVRHKPQLGRSYLLSVYDLKTLRLIKRIAPGYGGGLNWNNRHQIIHQWGCGTNCGNFRIYDLQLNELFFTFSTGGFLLSPEKNFLIQYSMIGNRICVYNLKQLKRGFKPLVYECDFDRDSTYDAKFISDNRIELLPNDTRLQNKYIDLGKVKWKRMAKKDVGEYYM